GPPQRCSTSRVALPCLSRHPTLPVASPYWLSHRPAAACRVALLAVASPCCCLSRRLALPAHRIVGSRTALPCLRVALPLPALSRPAARRPVARATRLLSALLRAALLAGALLPARRPAGSRTTARTDLLSDSRDSVSLFDHTFGASLAPPATANSATRSLWLTRDVAARLTVRNHLPLSERAHFGQHKTAKALYDAVVARYSSPATAALDRLILPYLFPEFGKRRSSKGKGGKSGGGGSGGSGGGSGAFDGGGGGSGGGGGGGGGGSGSGLLSVGRLGRPRWLELLRSGVDIFALDYDANLAAMYALSVSAEGDCYLCVLPDPGIDVAALGASESALPGTTPAEALHTFTLDSGASRCFFCDITTLTPLLAPVPVQLANPSGGPVLARSSTVLLYLAVPSGSLLGLHLPSFSTNLVSTAALQDAMVTTTTLGGQRVSICTCIRTGRHLATITRRPGSSLYTLTTEPPQVAASAQVSASSPVAAPCSCRLLSHQTLLWHHRLGHPSLPRLRGMHSRLSVSCLPRSLPPLPPSPAPPCLPSVEGRQRTAPHSSSFPPTTAPLQTLHMDVWGPARVSGQGRECYFLLVVDDYTWYTTVFLLRSKGEVPDVLIPWIRAVRLQLCERFRADLPVLRVHSDRGGEFSSDLLREFCRGEGILQSFTLPDSPQQNGIAERRIGLVMEVARTSMIHAVAPHFLWPFTVLYAAHQLNLWPRVSLPEILPTLRWMGKVGDASVFHVWGSRAFVCDTSADKLSFLGFPPDAPGWQFYHTTSRRVLPSQDVMFLCLR
ncbi:unnamed protein product, partial [Closterium sp. NIES-54]